LLIVLGGNMPLNVFSFVGFPIVSIIAIAIILFIKSEDENLNLNNFYTLSLVPMLGALVLTVLVVWVSSFSFLGNASDYKNLIGDVTKEAEMKDVIGKIDYNNAPIVSLKQAKEKARTIISEYGSQYQVKTFNKISYKGDLYWVSPLEYNGFFRWFNLDGSPGYVRISASNISDAELITTNEKGEKLNIVVQKQAYFADNIYNIAYFFGTMFKGLTDFSFEIDDEGNPYYVVTEYENTIGYDGTQVTGIYIVNAQNKNMEYFPTTIGDDSNIPEWVDNVYPESHMYDHVANWGEFINGSFNWSNDGKIKPTAGSKKIVGKDGKLYLYTGIQSYGADNGTLGFLFIDLRSKNIIKVNMVGSVEQKAKETVEENPVNIKKYRADFPIPVMVNGTPSYMMSLQTNNGLPKMFGFSSVEKHEISGVGETLREAQIAYESKLISGFSQGSTLSTNSNVESLTSKVLRINSQYTPSGTQYFILLRELPMNIFVSKIENGQDVVLTKEGDMVEISFIKRDSRTINILEFDNKNF
jgi:hypothetical protein